MIALPIKPLLPTHVDHVRGALLGRKHLAQMLDLIGRGPHPDEPGHIALWDFSGIESTTLSYLKATVLGLLRHAGVEIEGEDERPAGPPLNIFPMVYGLTNEVQEELDILLASRKVFCLEAQEYPVQGTPAERIAVATLRGNRDGVVIETLCALSKAKTASAAQLCETSASSAGVTAWNNRLADLHALRLARRNKNERQWIYESLAEQVH